MNLTRVPAARPHKDPAARIRAAFAREHAREVGEAIALQVQKARFDFATEERAELQREYDERRSLSLTQMKLDDEVVKKFIELV